MRYLLRLTLTLVAGTFAVLASGCDECSINPDEREEDRTVSLIAGVDDNFAPGNQEVVEPGAELLEFMLDTYQHSLLEHRFDQTAPNRPVGHTFYLPDVDIDHKADVKSAVLTIRLASLQGTSSNDRLLLYATDDEGNREPIIFWNLASLNNGQWQNGDKMTLNLDLSNLSAPQSEGGRRDVREFLSNGRLHIYVQDDTAVDFIKLDATYSIRNS